MVKLDRLHSPKPVWCLFLYNSSLNCVSTAVRLWPYRLTRHSISHHLPSHLLHLPKQDHCVILCFNQSLNLLLGFYLLLHAGFLLLSHH